MRVIGLFKNMYTKCVQGYAKLLSPGLKNISGKARQNERVQCPVVLECHCHEAFIYITCARFSGVWTPSSLACKVTQPPLLSFCDMTAFPLPPFFSANIINVSSLCLYTKYRRWMIGTNSQPLNGEDGLMNSIEVWVHIDEKVQRLRISIARVPRSYLVKAACFMF